MIRLTAKEIVRSDAGLTVIARPQAKGGIKIMVVRVEDGMALRGKCFVATVDHKSEVGKAAKEIARWISKMGYPSRMADAARHRG